MKKLILASFLAMSSMAGLIDLKDGFNGQSKRHFLKTIKNGDSVRVNFARPQYIESILISATGKQRAYSFGKVFADGEEIATLGVPGRDPIYPIIVRGRVSQITVFATEGSKFKIDNFKIYTANSSYSSYSSRPYSQRSEYGISEWGEEVLAIMFELDRLFDLSVSREKEQFSNLKKTAMRLAASEKVREVRSFKTYKKAKQLATIIQELDQLLLDRDIFIFNFHADRLLIDLLTIKEDIVEEYDFEMESL